MASHPIPGGVSAIAFLNQTSELLVVGGDGQLHRWDYSPNRESLEALDRLSDQLNGIPQNRGEATGSLP
jgi:hypothetical protein